MSNVTPSMSAQPLLIKLDPGFLLRIEAEREVITGGTGQKLPRTAMIRILIKEALDARARARGDMVPWAKSMGKRISFAEVDGADVAEGDVEEDEDEAEAEEASATA